MSMNPTDIMHPEDAKAIQVLKKMKGFDELIRWMMENGYEKQFRGDNLGCYLKVSDRNYKEIYQLFKGVVKQVSIKMPELYTKRVRHSRYPYTSRSRTARIVPVPCG